MKPMVLVLRKCRKVLKFSKSKKALKSKESRICSERIMYRDFLTKPNDRKKVINASLDGAIFIMMLKVKA